MRLRHGTRLPSPGHVPANLLKLSESQAHALVVDLAASRLYLFARRDGQLHLVRDRYVSTGRNGAAKRRQGDQRTPVGVYFTIGRIPVAELADFYGTGALPVSYPNGWDRLHGRSGYGIWIHGVPRWHLRARPAGERWVHGAVECRYEPSLGAGREDGDAGRHRRRTALGEH